MTFRPTNTLVLGLMLAFAAPSWGAEGIWDANGRVVCNATGSQSGSIIIPDGSGGSLLVWEDFRNGNVDIFAQRLNAAGVPQWTANGVAICTAADTQCLPQVLADGTGGAFIIWQDKRNGTNYAFYAQYINSTGTVQWTSNGVLVSDSSGNIYSNVNPAPVSDGAGGFIMAWQDYRSTEYHIYAQRLNASGVAQWTANGVVVVNAVLSQVSSKMIPDGSGGAILCWADYRGSEYQVYAQRINSSGVAQWAANGVVVSSAASTQYMPEMISDGASGAIVVWEDYRNGDMDLYAQRLNASGVMQWTANGVVVAVAANEQENQAIVTDNANGVIVAWDDFRSGTNYRVYAQRLNGSGVAQWTANGVLLCSDVHDQYSPKIAEDTAGGAIITWEDYRADGVDADQYIQRINAAGTLQWPSAGVVLSDATSSQGNQRMAPDGAGGTWVTWTDYRSGTGDIYVQRMVRLHPQLGSISPNTANQGATVNATLTGNYFTDSTGSLTGVRLTLSGQSDIVATNVSVTDAQHATCDFNLATAVPGAWQVVVTDTFSQSSAESVTLTVSVPLNSPTPTPTSTATPTMTSTPTSTATLTPTPTSTCSTTPTVTLTCTPSPSATPSLTGTATRTFTSTPTVTLTFTQTSTGTVTPVNTATPTPTPSSTLTPTHTLTSTFTRTTTYTYTPTTTATTVLSATPTLTASSTSTVSPTLTVSGTITLTETATPMFSSTQTPEVTATVTASRTETALATDTPRVLWEGEWRAFPNPARDKVTFIVGPSPSGEVSITMFNVLGEKVTDLHATLPTQGLHPVVCDCRSLSPGIYLVYITTRDQQKWLKLAIVR